MAYFYARDDEAEREVDLSGSLTPNQMKMVATQPDMLLQAARWIQVGILHREHDVRAEVGEPNGPAPVVSRSTDLTRVDDGPWVARDWVLPQDSIVTTAEYQRVRGLENEGGMVENAHQYGATVLTVVLMAFCSARVGRSRNRL